MNAKETYLKIKENVEKVIIGKGDVVDLAIIALFAGGHMLLDDVPGTGKTRLAKTLASSIDCSFARVQFTPDLLPSDLTGVNFFNMKESNFVFVKGPVFTNILLGDEINRATPKTQSGLIECMEERQVTVEGTTYPLEKPFLVIATQNPVESLGTFPLPEAQLDRFLFKANMRYPTQDEEVSIVRGNHGDASVVVPVAGKADIDLAAKELDAVSVTDALIDYAVRIVRETRGRKDVLLGASPRSAIHLIRAAKGFAVISGREYVLPDDIKRAAVPVLAHRLVLSSAAEFKRDADAEIIEEILLKAAVPTEEAI